MNDSKRLGVTTRTTKGHQSAVNEETDAQVAQIRDDPRPPSLCDVVVEELLQGRHPDRPLLSRVAIVGEISKREEPVRNVIESLMGIATKYVNGEDPCGGTIKIKVADTAGQADPAAGSSSQTTTATVNITGVCVEYQSHFVAFFESEPLHLAELMKGFLGRVVKPKSTVGNNNLSANGKSGTTKKLSIDGSSTAASVVGATAISSAASAAKDPKITPSASVAAVTLFDNVQIIYQVDDIISRSTTLWTHIDISNTEALKASGAASANLSNANALFSAVPLNDQIVKAVHNLISLGAHAQGLATRALREHFSTAGAVATHSKLIPPLNFIAGCIKSDLCLTVSEYVEIFCLLPSVDRDKELLNPLEPTLHY